MNEFTGNLILGGFYEDLTTNLNLFQIGQQYRAFYTSTKVSFIVAICIKSPYEGRLPVYWYRALRVSEEM
jgi:hypothetical protein